MTQEVIEAPIPGKIMSVSVRAGDKVEMDQELCCLQSMKMQNLIQSPVDGTVTEVRIAEGQTVQPGDVLIVIEDS